jgi:hypothetical protein
MIRPHATHYFPYNEEIKPPVHYGKERSASVVATRVVRQCLLPLESLTECSQDGTNLKCSL